MPCAVGSLLSRETRSYEGAGGRGSARRFAGAGLMTLPLPAMPAVRGHPPPRGEGEYQRHSLAAVLGITSRHVYADSASQLVATAAMEPTMRVRLDGDCRV